MIRITRKYIGQVDLVNWLRSVCAIPIEFHLNDHKKIVLFSSIGRQKTAVPPRSIFAASLWQHSRCQIFAEQCLCSVHGFWSYVYFLTLNIRHDKFHFFPSFTLNASVKRHIDECSIEFSWFISTNTWWRKVARRHSMAADSRWVWLSNVLLTSKLIPFDLTVHTIPWDMDYVLTTGKQCPSYDYALKNHMKNSPEVQRIYTEYADLFSSWSKNSGAKIETISDVYRLHDTLMVEKEQNKLLVNF